MRSPSSLSPAFSPPPLFIILLLRRRNLAVDVVKRARRSDKDCGDRKHPGIAKASVQPLADEDEYHDYGRELDPDPSEIGTGQTLRGALLRPFFLIHSALKLTACEDFHKLGSTLEPKAARKFTKLATPRNTRS
ncbi:MAG TPA: hypothetical protein VLJ83_09135 [Gemmatimonadaceae bacterium]|nr:hypothetical protein [Gemmatimonadaceae bacterium]